MTDPQDQAELRLRAADPAGPARALPPPRVERAELLEGIMSTTTEAPAPTPPPKSSRPRWLLAAAAVIAIAAAGTAVALTVDSGSSNHPVATKTVRTLQLPNAGRPGTTSCIRFMIDILREKPVAFDGTATDVTDSDVLLTVNHWYKGGSADEVRLENYHTPDIALEGGVDFRVGHRYLVTATDGTVNVCGYTAEWSPELAKSFQQAFGG
jgi:hypothetical protein